MSFLCRENGGQQVMFFSGIFMSYPQQGDLLYLIRNKCRLLIEQIQATVFSNQIGFRPICTGKTAGGC